MTSNYSYIENGTEKFVSIQYCILISFYTWYIWLNVKKNYIWRGLCTVTFIFQRQDFPWSSEVQGLVLSSFFYGYIVTQIPGGWLATQIGGRKLFGIGVGMTALVTLLTPALASANLYLLVLGRVVEGLFEVC
jgi:MFS family permease